MLKRIAKRTASEKSVPSAAAASTAPAGAPASKAAAGAVPAVAGAVPVKRAPRRPHRRTTAFAVPAIPESIPPAASAQTAQSYTEILFEELALLKEERGFPNNTYFKMGVALAVCGLVDAGKIDARPQAADEVVRYLRTFGIRSAEDVRSLGAIGAGANLSQLERVYAASMA